MNVAFRVDASSRIGTGHLMRCLTLAETLHDRGVETTFLCREHAGNLIAMLEGRGNRVLALPISAATNAESSEPSAWLGVPAAEDARQTAAALKAAVPDWLVVDNYGIDADWERQVRPHAGRILVIDDLADRFHDCDMLLDQNHSARGAEAYSGLVPPHCRVLVGPRFALLSPEYAARRADVRRGNRTVRRVFVFFGGADSQNVSSLAMLALAAPEFAHLDVDLVVGPSNPRRAALEAMAAARPRTTVHGPRPHLADLMAVADLALGAGGATTWERMCLGLPSLVVVTGENQVAAARLLDDEGRIRLIGRAGELTVDALRTALRDQLRGSDGDRAGRSEAAMTLCDGAGAGRVADAMLGTESGS